MKLFRTMAFLLGFAALYLTGVQAAGAVGAAYFPSTPTAVQITRNISMQEAAQDGMLLLGAKGGYEGDSVLLELAGQQVHGPVTVTVHEEMWAESNHSDEELGRLQKKLEGLARSTEAELNRPHYKTRRGEPINFVMDWKFRKEDEPETPNYNQVLIVEPLMDFEKPDPLWRTHVDELGVPNSPGTVEAEFAYEDLKPGILAHETLHMVGLDDRYSDVYAYKGREIPLPSNGMSTAELTAYLKTVKPPVPAPPAGNVGSKNIPGTKRCDIMGTGALLSCRKLSKRDLKLIESEVGVSVEAKPGEVLLNKDSASQNLIVGYPTHVFAGPGETTVAPGVSTYCLDHKKLPPSGSEFPVGPSAANFDVGPPASAVPGFGAIGKLAELNATLQPSLTEPVPAVQNALWNQTDGTALTEEAATSEQIAQTRELLSKAGAGENTSGTGLTHLEDPNAGSTATGAVGADGAILPVEPSEAVSPPPAIEIDTAMLEPKIVPASRIVRSTLVVGAGGTISKLELRLQSQAGHRWRSVKTLPGRKLATGIRTFPLSLGHLRPGKYRLLVTVSGPGGEAESAAAPLTVRGKP